MWGFFLYYFVYSKTFHIFVGMNILLLIFIILVWAISSVYVMYYHNKHYTLGLDMVIGAILLGPILALIVGKDVEEKKKYYGVMEQESNDRHRRWFQTLGLINRQRIPNYGRSIPPPPPISRVERARTERDEAIRSAIERIDKNKLKDFKFLRSNVKDTER
jgi:zinc transporter ZupT